MASEHAELEHYVTLFDSLFLPQGLALHASLKRHGGKFLLWVLCMDENVKAVLDTLGEPTIRTVALHDVETPELLAVKSGRSRAEYCWTLTPYTPKIVFDRDASAKRATYVDADVFFLQSPVPLLDELDQSGKAVLITDHAYDAEYDQSATSGQYCVQFMTFRREASEPVRRWWQDRCIEWCFNQIEDGKFGDQKYLDDWPTRFGGLVHVLTKIDLLLAPWNARRFPYSRAVAWHFHGLRLLRGGKVVLHGPYIVPDVVRQVVYDQYVQELKRSLNILGLKELVQNHADQPTISRLKALVAALLKQLRQFRNYHPIRMLPK